MFPLYNKTLESGGTNHSDQDHSFDSFLNTIALVERLAVPFICLLGLVGNTVSFILFTQRSLRHKSCSLFLATRSFSDNGFLLTLLTVWISSVFDLRLSGMVGICQSIIFLTYVFGCMSVWLVVFVTFENYIRICKPYMVKRICKAPNAKFAVIVLLACVLGSYNFPLWTMTEECQPDDRYYAFVKIMVYTDSLLTLVLPTLIMTLLMSQIAMTSITSWKFRRQLSLSSRQQKRSNPMSKVTGMLLAVTLIFFILNMPSHVIRFRLMALALADDTANVTESLDLGMQSVSQLIYYLSLAVNVFVYYVFSSTFRKVFYRLCHWKKRSASAKSENTVSTSLTSRKYGKLFRTFSCNARGNKNVISIKRCSL